MFEGQLHDDIYVLSYKSYAYLGQPTFHLCLSFFLSFFLLLLDVSICLPVCLNTHTEREREREREEGNALFNDALNTFYLRLYGVARMVKDHTNSERGNPLSPHGLLFQFSSKGSFYMHHPTDRITHTRSFVTPVVEHWIEREIAQWVHHEGSIR